VYEREKIMRVHHQRNDWSGRGSGKTKKKKKASRQCSVSDNLKTNTFKLSMKEKINHSTKKET
jgi:hypothetical protein